MSEKQTPIRAYVVRRFRLSTVAAVKLFGREVWREFTGLAHDRLATEWAADWDKHLRGEWETVRASVGMIMQEYTKALRRAGVPDKMIDAAFLKVKAIAEELKGVPIDVA